MTSRRKPRRAASPPAANGSGTKTGGDGIRPEPAKLLQRLLDEHDLELVQGIAQERTESGKLLIGPTCAVRYRQRPAPVPQDSP